MMSGADSVAAHEEVNSIGPPRSFGTVLKSKLKETFLPDDPFGHLKNEPSYLLRTKKAIQYFVPILEWLPNYSFSLFKCDLLAGLTIASLAIPQGISYAKLAKIPPIVGLYSSFVPPLVYAVFGSSKHLAVGTVAASSLLIAATIEEKVTPAENPELFVSLVFTTCFVSGLLQTTLGACRLGILVDFLSHSTITGFMGGTTVLICLQQLKDMLGMKHFTTHTDMVSVLRVVFRSRKEVRGFLLNYGVYYATRAALGLTFEWSLPVAFITTFVTMFALVIAITKDLPDVEGDRKFQISTLATNLGVRNIAFLGSGLLLINYICAVLAAIYFPQAFRRSLMIPTHVALALGLIIQAWKLEKTSYTKEAISAFYRFIWNLFYSEYIIFPFL